MTPTSAVEALGVLRRSAQERRQSEARGEFRVVVQVGHCSQSVGAADIAQTLASSAPDNAYVVIAGCDGACFEAPRVIVTGPSGSQRFDRVSPNDADRILAAIDGGLDDDYEEAEDFFARQRRVAMQDCGRLDGSDIDDYLIESGYQGLAKALDSTAEDVIEEVKASGLRGRGGAYFPAALKWEGVRNQEARPAYLVVNSEEGEPGIFKDRHLMEGVPHRIIEGAAIAAYAAGAQQAYIYVNAEAELSAERMQTAASQAYDRGLLGENVLVSDFSLNVEIRRGAGGYVCGEETTLLDTMEGYRREPRLKPPYPTEAGLFGKPTVINNPETLVSVPYILANGAKAFSEIGSDGDSGTKLISLSGSVNRPGVVEVPMGTTLRQIVDDIGGGPPSGRTVTALAVGGPSSGVFPASMLDTPIKPGMLHESGVMLGAGGVIALDDRTEVLDAVRKLAAYNADESCGKCTPCREGTPRIVEVIDRLRSGDGSPQDLDELRYLADVVGAASLCGLGQAAGGPITSALHFFPTRFARGAGVS